MEFDVRRASDRFGRVPKPCDKAYKIYYSEREEDLDRWAIEINSLEELMEFAKENGRFVLCPGDSYYPHLPEIIIYDDYIE